jgi:hypothetical protein
MKSLFFLTAFFAGFGFLTHQFSLWFAIGAIYLIAIGLVALIAFSQRKPQKSTSTPTTLAGS